MAKLIQLPTGTWINPTSIHSIKALPKLISKNPAPPRIIINYNDQVEVIYAEDYEKAKATAAEIAQAANASVPLAPLAP